jgi:hypothetical protein
MLRTNCHFRRSDTKARLYGRTCNNVEQSGCKDNGYLLNICWQLRLRTPVDWCLVSARWEASHAAHRHPGPRPENLAMVKKTARRAKKTVMWAAWKCVPRQAAHPPEHPLKANIVR